MNPLKWPIELVRFIYDDLKSDVQTIAEIYRRSQKGDPILRADFKAELKDWWHSLTLYGFLKENWLLFMLLAAFFISGWWLASQYYQSECNRFIVENIYNTTRAIGPAADNWSLPNWSVTT